MNNPESDSIFFKLVNRHRRIVYFMGIYELLYGIQPIDDPEKNEIWLGNFKKWFAEIKIELDKD